MTLFSGTDLPVLLAVPVLAGAVGGALYLTAWRQARRRRRAASAARMEAAAAQSAAAVARAASTSPAP